MWNRKLLRSSTMMVEGLIGFSTRLYSSNPKVVDLKKMRPMILKRIDNRAKDYPVKPMVPVANDVIHSRNLLIQGVSTLIHTIPIWACKSIYWGEKSYNSNLRWLQTPVQESGP